MVLKAVVAEDNIIFRKELINIISSFNGIELEYVGDNGEDLLVAVEKIRPEVVILDIGLPGISGIDVAKMIRKQMVDTEIIFITGYEDYIKEAISLYSADYINKPLDVKRLKETLNRIKRKFNVIEEPLQLKSDGEIKVVPQQDICFIEALKKKSKVYTSFGDFICDYSLKELEQFVNRILFFKSSRSYLINIAKVDSIKNNTRTSFQILFKDIDSKAYLSKNLYLEFREKIKNVFN